jgi:NADH-ubiquinone oxidoreductase chain 2
MIIIGIILLILSNAVNLKRDSSILNIRITITILLYSLYIGYLNIFVDFLENDISLYSGLFTLNSKRLLFDMFILVLTILILFISSAYTNNKRDEVSSSYIYIDGNLSSSEYNDNNLKNCNSLIHNNITNKTIKEKIWKEDYEKHSNVIKEENKIIEYPLIILFCITGSMLLISSSDLISMFLSIELQSYALYLMCSIYRNSENSVSAGLTYFLLGGLSSCIILLGQSFIYANTGTTNIENIFVIKSVYENYYNDLIEYNNSLINIQYSFIILSIGLLFKVSSAPFHF